MVNEDEGRDSLQESLLREAVWRAPLLGVALAFTAGIVLDRYVGVPFVAAVVAGAVSTAGHLLMRWCHKTRLSLAYLAVAIASLGAAWHHFQQLAAPDDVCYHAGPQPVPVRLRGTLDSEPRRIAGENPYDPNPSAPLRSRPTSPGAMAVLSVTHLWEDDAWRPASGRVRLSVSGTGRDPSGLLAGLHAGDELEVRGQLDRIRPPGNPGEHDSARRLGDRGVRASVRVNDTHQVVRTAIAWHTSLTGWTGAARETGHRLLDEQLGDDPAMCGLARALLLGEGAPLTRDDWAKYTRTGVIHVLAISGQHLVIVAYFLWIIVRLVGIRLRQAVVVITVFLVIYALITGGQPPAMRAAVGACIVCGGALLRRPVLHANSLSAAWLVVVALQPSDAFDPGPQMSFFSVVVLAWCASPLSKRNPDALERFVDSTRPLYARLLINGLREIRNSYLICAVVWVAIAPLVAFHTGTLAPAGLLLGPPLGLLTSLALLFGFVLMMTAGWLPVVSVGLAAMVGFFLRCCEFLVDGADGLQTHLYLGPLPFWLAVVFCLGIVGLFGLPITRPYRRWLIPGTLCWLALALVAMRPLLPPGELHCTFLDVGHGTCVVLQLPDGRVILYDAGSMSGPQVARQQIVPFLRTQGIGRIDDIILSHADLDHYNGLAGLLEQFAVGRVLLHNSFPRRDNIPVRVTLDLCDRYRVPVVEVRRGDRLNAAGAALTVVHPPEGFGGANENARSVVVEVRHAEHTILLTGDLEGEGLAEVVRQAPRRADVMQAPHHGSHSVDVGPLLDCVAPTLAVSGQGLGMSAAARTAHLTGSAPDAYEKREIDYWTTYRHGAVTVTSRPGHLAATTFTSRIRQVLSAERGGP